MQYLASGSISNVKSAAGMLLYENEKNELVIGQLDGL